ncbi:hypothetical protein EV121DRAFT_297177 [Schizophyllum commune]
MASEYVSQSTERGLTRVSLPQAKTVADISTTLADFAGFRRLRSGKIFSQYYVVPDASFSLNKLGLAAAVDEQDEPQPPIPADDEPPDDWEDEEDSPLSSAPSTPPPSRAAMSRSTDDEPPSPLSPLSSAPSTPTPPSTPLPSIAAQPDPAPLPAGRKRRRKAHSHKMRAQKRRAATSPSQGQRRHYAQHIVRAGARKVSFDLRKAAVTSTGFRGRYEEETCKTYRREQLLRKGFVYFPWDGREVTTVVTPQPDEPEHDATEDSAEDEEDEEDVVIGVLAGCCSDGENSGHGEREPYDAATSSLAAEIEAARGRATFSKAARIHRHGLFGAEACGISHGGGQTHPANLKHSVAMTLVLMYLISLPAMVRVAHFSSSAFATWAPAIHTYYGDTLTALLDSDPTLRRNFAKSVWSCITINFGPRTVTYPHRDYGNLSYGWCAITALGDYDPDHGGELILWDCKMIIRFPPGSTILIPSAILRHSNTRIKSHERRYSVTQYTAGSIFRWVEHGFQLDDAYYASLSPEEVRQDRRTAAGRWRRGRRMFSKLSDLVANAEKELAK